MNKTIRIYVTPADIARGCKGKSDNCPIARAVNRKLAMPYTAEVGGTLINIRAIVLGTKSKDGSRAPLVETGPILATIPLPDKASTFIGNYDSSSEEFPRFNFRVPVPVRFLPEGQA